MQLKAQKFITERVFVFLDQTLVKDVGWPVNGASRQAVNIKRNVVFRDQIEKGRALRGVFIEKVLSRNGKVVMKLKSALTVQKSVLFKTFYPVVAVNVEKFHFRTPYLTAVVCLIISCAFLHK